jgi:hypothetical protein
LEWSVRWTGEVLSVELDGLAYGSGLLGEEVVPQLGGPQAEDVEAALLFQEGVRPEDGVGVQEPRDNPRDAAEEVEGEAKLVLPFGRPSAPASAE